MAKRLRFVEMYTDDRLHFLRGLKQGDAITTLSPHPAKNSPLFPHELPIGSTDLCLGGDANVVEVMYKIFPWDKRQRRVRRILCRECGAITDAWNPSEVTREIKRRGMN